MKENPRFIELLISKGIISHQTSQQLLSRYSNDAFAVLKHLLNEGIASRDKLARLWGDSLGYSYVDLTRTLFQSQVVNLIPEDFARKNKIITIYQIGDAITAATPEPENNLLLGEAENLTHKTISPVFALPEEIEDAIEIEYRSEVGVEELSSKIPLHKFVKNYKHLTAEQLKAIGGNEAVIEFANALLLLGIKERASDIHIEPGENYVRIRFRIDGVLQERLELDNSILQPLASRLKIMANLDITERRHPQDGRIKMPLSSRSIDFRFSSVPALYGEKIVLRILGQLSTKDVLSLEELNLSKPVLEKLIRVIETPNGIFFVTGPTGSGKTTTLYAALKHLNKPSINIMTIEDPVEYRLPGINQVQVNTGIGFNFASALRSFLRQDPDVILVGEVRDLETAKISSQAAMTGHLVMATMHTNNSIQAVTRLIEIGVEPFLVAPSVIGVLAQRLVRKICEKCKKKYKLSPEEIENIFIWDGKTDVYFYRGKGCSECHGTGYAGRIAIYEIFILDTEIRAMVAKDLSILDIMETAYKHGFKNLRYDGIKKVLRGLTTIEEIDRVTISD